MLFVLDNPCGKFNRNGFGVRNPSAPNLFHEAVGRLPQPAGPSVAALCLQSPVPCSRRGQALSRGVWEHGDNSSVRKGTR